MARAQRAVWLIIAVVIAFALVAGGVALLASYNKAPLPVSDRCVATVNGRTTTIDPEQARNAAIITGVSIKRGLIPRAATIALATAYQESGIRNLDYGHADSLGLFQQRPSKGWGTQKQVTDPWYSSTSFYKALVRVKKWKTKDINDAAQAVQRSAYPEAYRRHVSNARTLASSLTGQSPASFSCIISSPGTGDAKGMQKFLTKTLGDQVSVTFSDQTLVVTATTTQTAWAVAHLAIANTSKYGLASVRIGQYGWSHSSSSLAAWQGTGENTATQVALDFTTATPR